MSDYISRADAIKAICNAQCELDVPHYPQCDQVKYCDEIKALLALPSADAVQGEWIRHELFGNPWFTCSECSYHGRNDFNYCPNCGADMRGNK